MEKLLKVAAKAEDAWNEAWGQFWRDPANLPEATYTITVTDARWFAHLKRGQTWRSAAYG